MRAAAAAKRRRLAGRAPVRLHAEGRLGLVQERAFRFPHEALGLQLPYQKVR
jgi:hypothetical protein